MRIGLNAGHTLSGAGSGTSGAIVESIETRRVCNRLTEMFKSAGVEVIPCTVDNGCITVSISPESCKYGESHRFGLFY